MRTLTRSILAAGAVAGLLALPVASAGSAESGSTTATLSLVASGGSLAVTVPTGSLGTPVDLSASGAQTIAAGTFTTDGLGEVTASDTRTGLLRVTTVNTASGLTGGSLNAPVAFCQDQDGPGGDTNSTLECSAEDNEVIALAQADYVFGAIDETGTTQALLDLNLPPVASDGPLGTANLASAEAVTGVQEWAWTPTFDVTLLGTEVQGTYYGVIEHSISSTP